MKKILIILIIVLMSGLISAQEGAGGGFDATNNSSAYFYSGSMAGSEQLKIYTYVWGQVRKPGMYIVPDNTDLLALLSLAGGPTENAKLTKVKIVRPTATGEKIIWINLNEYLETGAEDMIPKMKPGDTVMVSGTIFYAFTKAMDFLSKVTIAISVYSLIKG